MGLFRDEALEHASDRLHGEVNISVPRAWEMIGLVVLAIVVSACIFLMTATYSKTEVVDGLIVPSAGVIKIVTPKDGIVRRTWVKIGDKVFPQSPLVMISAEEPSVESAGVQQQLLTAMAAQEQALSSQMAGSAAAADAESSRLNAGLRGARAELSGVQDQIRLQEQVVATAERDLQRVRSVANSGFISQKDFDERELKFLQAKQQLAALRQDAAAKSAQIEEYAKAAAKARATAEVQAAGTDYQRSELRQAITRTQANQTFVLRSPVAGRVAALTAIPGEPASAREPTLLIAPEGSHLVAELHIQSGAIGFIQPGQEVHVALADFPYEQFGTIPGRIISISSAPTTPRDSPSGDPVYVAKAELGRSSISAFGIQRPLLPGMKLTARVTTRKRSLVGWLFEPLFAVGNR